MVFLKNATTKALILVPPCGLKTLLEPYFDAMPTSAFSAFGSTITSAKTSPIALLKFRTWSTLSFSLSFFYFACLSCSPNFRLSILSFSSASSLLKLENVSSSSSSCCLAASSLWALPLLLLDTEKQWNRQAAAATEYIGTKKELKIPIDASKNS